MQVVAVRLGGFQSRGQYQRQGGRRRKDVIVTAEVELARRIEIWSETFFDNIAFGSYEF